MWGWEGRIEVNSPALAAARLGGRVRKTVCASFEPVMSIPERAATAAENRRKKEIRSRDHKVSIFPLREPSGLMLSI